MKDTIKI